MQTFTEFESDLFAPARKWIEASGIQAYKKQSPHPIDMVTSINRFFVAPERRPFLTLVIKELEDNITCIEQRIDTLKEEKTKQLKSRYPLIDQEQIRVIDTAERIRQVELFQDDLASDDLIQDSRVIRNDMQIIRDELTRQKREAFSSPDPDTLRMWIQADALSDFQQNERKLFLDGFIGFDCKWDFQPRGSKARYLEYFKLLIDYEYFNATVNRSRVTYSDQRTFMIDRYGSPGIELMKESMLPELTTAAKAFPFIRPNVKYLTK